jgi:uncharacterized iron-regulated membrane protein
LKSEAPALLKKAWKHPQQLWLRRAFFQVHLWCGVILALYVIAIGISGSILVFKDELMPRPHVAGLRFDANGCTPQRLVAAMDAAARAHPEMTVSLASCPIEANPLYAVTLHSFPPGNAAVRSLTVYVHPESSRVLGQVVEQSTWVGIVEDFHLDLLLKNHGRQWNGVAAAILLSLVLTGIFLWWPGVRNWRRALKVDFRRTWKRINWDLHSAAGIWTLFFTFTFALTGIYFAWPAPFERAINRVSPIVTANYPEDEMSRIAARAPSRTAHVPDWGVVLEDAVAHSEGAHLEGMFFGSGPNAVLTIYMARAHLGDYTNTDFVYSDQQTGQHLYTWHRGQNKTLGDWILWLAVPLHFGTSWGFPGKVLWCALGLVLPLLAVTGLLMYWNRWLRKAVRFR